MVIFYKSTGRPDTSARLTDQHRTAGADWLSYFSTLGWIKRKGQLKLDRRRATIGKRGDNVIKAAERSDGIHMATGRPVCFVLVIEKKSLACKRNGAE